MKTSGAESCTNWRQRPFGNLTKSPSTSAPADCHSSRASGKSWKAIPISLKMISAFSSIRTRPSSSNTSTGGNFRSKKGREASGPALLSARRAARPPPLRVATLNLLMGFSALPASTTALSRSLGNVREIDQRFEMRCGRGRMRKRHRINK